MSTKIEDYRMVEFGVMIAHAGRSNVIITRFGDNLIKAGPATTRLEESWTIDDVAFNVPGLSMDCFIPPQGTPERLSTGRSRLEITLAYMMIICAKFWIVNLVFLFR